MKPSYWKTPITPYSKSIGLGGGNTLYPLSPDNVPQLAETIRKVIRKTEERAYEAGRRDAQTEMRMSLGLPQ